MTDLTLPDMVVAWAMAAGVTIAIPTITTRVPISSRTIGDVAATWDTARMTGIAGGSVVPVRTVREAVE